MYSIVIPTVIKYSEKNKIAVALKSDHSPVATDFQQNVSVGRSSTDTGGPAAAGRRRPR